MEREIAKQLALAYLPYVFGVIFSLVMGIFFLLQPSFVFRKHDRAVFSQTSPKHLRIIGIVVILIGLTAVMLTCVGASPSERWRVMKRVLSSSQEDILAAEIICWRRNTTELISERPLVVTDRDRLSTLCSCLNTSVSWNLGHPATVWECKLRLRRDSGTDTCSIESDGKGLTLLWIYDRDTGGLSIGNPIGTFRCNALGPVIESWSKGKER